LSIPPIVNAIRFVVSARPRFFIVLKVLVEAVAAVAMRTGITDGAIPMTTQL